MNHDCFYKKLPEFRIQTACVKTVLKIVQMASCCKRAPNYSFQKNIFTSPESEAMATCFDCIEPETKEKKGPCFCKKTPNKFILKRSASLKQSPPKSQNRSFSFAEKRSLSMSSLNRSRSVQKLDFSMDMSVDGSFHDHGKFFPK